MLDFGYSWSSKQHPENKLWYFVTTIYLRNKDDTNRENTTMMLQSFIGNPEHLKGIHVDHINHDTLDNRKCNLRITRVDQNTKNRKSKNTNNVSGYRNVAYMKRYKKKPYHVQIVIDGKNTVLGKFSDVHEAGRFAEEMRQKYYGDYAGES